MIEKLIWQIVQFRKPIPSNTSWAFKLISVKYDLLMKWDRIRGRKPEPIQGDEDLRDL